MPDFLDKIVDLIKQREAKVDQASAEFLQGVEKAQKVLNRQIQQYFSDLKTQGGKVLNVPANIQMAQRTRKNMRMWLRNSGYYDSLKDYESEFDEVVMLGREYFRAMDLSGAFTERDIESLSLFRKAEMNFMADADETVIRGVYDELISGVYSNRSWVDMQRRLGSLIAGTEQASGILGRYLSTRAVDAIAGFDRQLSNIKAAQNGMEFFIYSGGVIRDSREWCVAHAGKVYTRAEINAWEKQSWTGKNPRQSVWIACGGYNCQHILSPVTEEMAERLRGKMPTKLKPEEEKD